MRASARGTPFLRPSSDFCRNVPSTRKQLYQDLIRGDTTFRTDKQGSQSGRFVIQRASPSPPIQWHGYGTLDLPFDRGSPRWPAVGHGKRTPRRHVSVHIAIASRGYVVTVRSKSPDDLASAAERIVFVIDDDVAMRATLSSLFRSMGLRVELSEADIRIPIIFMTGHGDIPMSVKAMKAGAVDFLTKPFRDQDILDAVSRALERDQKRRDTEKAVSELRILFDSLTSREREVMTLVVAGLMNKQIAAKLGITEITVKVHRGHMMRKMKARSLVDLVAMADLLGIRRPIH